MDAGEVAVDISREEGAGAIATNGFLTEVGKHAADEFGRAAISGGIGEAVDIDQGAMNIGVEVEGVVGDALGREREIVDGAFFEDGDIEMRDGRGVVSFGEVSAEVALAIERGDAEPDFIREEGFAIEAPEFAFLAFAVDEGHDSGAGDGEIGVIDPAELAVDEGEGVIVQADDIEVGA